MPSRDVWWPICLSPEASSARYSMITLPSRTTAAGLNAAYSSQCTVLSLIGDRKVDVARGASTGLTSRGFSNGPNIQVRSCARSGGALARPSMSTVAERSTVRLVITDTSARGAARLFRALGPIPTLAATPPRETGSMTQPVVQLRRRGFGETMRRDAWWLQPLGGLRRPRRVSSSTRRGPRSRTRTTSTGPTSRRSTRPRSSATRRTRGSPKPGGGSRRSRRRC